MIGIKTDPERLLKYLRNCLRMEGFVEKDIKSIAHYVTLDGNI